MRLEDSNHIPTMFKVLGFPTGLLLNKGLGKLPLLSTVYKWSWRTLVPRSIIMVEANGFQFLASTKDWAVTPVLYFRKEWEPSETAIVKRLVHSGMKVLDVGAHIGYYTLLMSHLVGKDGQVHAFEPNPSTQTLLIANMVNNAVENVLMHPFAAYDRRCQLELYCDESPASSSIVKPNTDVYGVKVQAMPLDECFNDGVFDFVKMDIEGAEIYALRGMRGIIKRSPSLNMIVELCPSLLQRQGASLEAYIDLISEDFDISLIQRHGLVPYRDTSQFDYIRRKGLVTLLCSKRGDNAPG